MSNAPVKIVFHYFHSFIIKSLSPHRHNVWGISWWSFYCDHYIVYASKNNRCERSCWRIGFCTFSRIGCRSGWCSNRCWCCHVIKKTKKNEYESANVWNRNKQHEKPEQSPFYNIDDEELVGDRQAVEADRYRNDFAGDALSDGEKQAKARQYHEQKAEPNSLGYSKQNSPNQNWENLKENCGGPGDKDLRKPQLKSKDLFELRRWVVEEVPLPLERFDYTSCVVMNSFTQGPLHIFARHSDQWLSMIPGLADLMEQLPPIIRYTIDGIQYIPERDQTPPKMKKIYKKLEDDIESEIEEIEIRAVLFKIQLKILDFLRKSVQGEYLSISRAPSGYRLEFRVTNPQGDRKVLILPMSRQKDQKPEFFNDRPFRTIITAFFKD